MQMRNNFRTAIISATLCLFLALSANAQLGISIEMNHHNYMQFEAVHARVSLRNFSGHPLIFGESEQLQGTIRFEITDPDGQLIQLNTKNHPTITGLLIEPGKTKQVIISVSSFYRILALGRYTLRAYVSHPQLQTAFQSENTTFTISQGMPIWQHQVGIPQLINAGKPNEQIPQRRFRISSLYDGSRNYFYLTVDDDDNIYCLRRIGVEMSKFEPNCEIDHLSRLHILIPTNPRVFSYYIFNPDGSVDKEAVYRRTNTTPQLIRNAENGNVVLIGGAEAREDIDFKKDENKPFENSKAAAKTTKATDKNQKPEAPRNSFSEKLKNTKEAEKTAQKTETTGSPTLKEGDKLIEDNNKALESAPSTKDPEIKKKSSIWGFIPSFSKDTPEEKAKAEAAAKAKAEAKAKAKANAEAKAKAKADRKSVV